MGQKTMSQRRILLGYAVDVFGPLAAYWATTKLGIPVLWGLAFGIGIAVVSTGINTIKRGRLDGVGLLVLVEMAVSIALLIWQHTPLTLLIRPSFYSGIAAVWLMGSAFTAKPLTREGSKPFATRDDPVRTIAWERAWREVPQFRMAHRTLTFSFGLASMADAVLRVAVVYRYPVDPAAWLSNLPHLAAMVILLIAGAVFGRWAGPIVDRMQAQVTAERTM